MYAGWVRFSKGKILIWTLVSELGPGFYHKTQTQYVLKKLALFDSGRNKTHGSGLLKKNVVQNNFFYVYKKKINI